MHATNYCPSYYWLNKNQERDTYKLEKKNAGSNKICNKLKKENIA